MAPHTREIATDACPTREKLVAYGLGTLREDDIMHLAVHLEHCAMCLETLNSLDDRADALVSSLAGMRDGTTATGADDEYRILEHIAGIVATVPARAERKLPPRQVGAYEIVEPLAEGGMGAVYKARHVYLGKIVALKLLSSERVADGLSIARFMQEMKALGQLSHPNIVQAYDAGVETVPFLAMEFLEGMDLARLVKERGPMSVPHACECVRQAALALHHTFTCGLVHRDIKPANLLLTPNGCVKLLDLGLARFGPDLPREPDKPGRDETITSAGAVVGTIDYIAPEQLMDSRTVDCRADLYSLGCTLYYLLTGVPPFGREWEGNIAKRQAHLNEPSPNIRLARPGMAEELAVIVERLLAKNPDFRFVTPAELAATLQPFTAGCTLAGLSDVSASESSYHRAVPLPSAQQAPPPSYAFARALIAVGFLAGIALGITFLATRPMHDSKDVPRIVEKKSLGIEAMEMDLFRRNPKDHRLLGSVGAKDAFRHDSFRVTARVSEPAHLYLVAYMPDGKAILCTPDQDAAVPTRMLVFPREGLLTLDEAGMHAFVLLASRGPLPRGRLDTGPLPWPKSENVGGGAWKFDGQQISGLPPGSSPAPPGFKELCNLFTARPGVDAVQAIAITVQPDPAPAKTEAQPKK